MVCFTAVLVFFFVCGSIAADLLSCASSASGAQCVDACVCSYVCKSAKHSDFDLRAKLTTESEHQNEASEGFFFCEWEFACSLLHVGPKVNLN